MLYTYNTTTQQWEPFGGTDEEASEFVIAASVVVTGATAPSQLDAAWYYVETPSQ